MGIKQGDTPENNGAAKMVLQWIDEFLLLVGQKPKKQRKIGWKAPVWNDVVVQRLLPHPSRRSEPLRGRF